MSDAVARARHRLDTRLGDPDRLHFPADWTLSTSWQRAQSADSMTERVTPATWDVVLGSGDCHRVLFTVYDGAPRAECDCPGHNYHDWCAHVAHLWWRWVRGDLVVTDLDSGSRYLTPPAWVRVDDESTPEPDATAEPNRAVADGGRTHAESARARTIPSADTPGGCHADTSDTGECPEGAAIDRVMRDRDMSCADRGIGGDARER